MSLSILSRRASRFGFRDDSKYCRLIIEVAVGSRFVLCRSRSRFPDEQDAFTHHRVKLGFLSDSGTGGTPLVIEPAARIPHATVVDGRSNANTALASGVKTAMTSDFLVVSRSPDKREVRGSTPRWPICNDVVGLRLNSLNSSMAH